MNRETAFHIVLKELEKCNLFTGVYDAKNGNEDYMYGIFTVMENIAYNAGEEIGINFSEMFLNNLIESEKQ